MLRLPLFFASDARLDSLGTQGTYEMICGLM